MPPTTEVKLLTRHFEVKQVDVSGRTFEGLAATWDRDLGGDVIEKGAFRKTLREWKKSGRSLPLLDSHNWFSVHNVVGKLIEAEEKDEGLWTKWLVVPGSEGDEVLNRLRPDPEHGAFIDSMSIGYRPVKFKILDPGDAVEEPTRVLQEVELHEVSLVLFPMNPQATIDSSSVKTLAGAVGALVNRCPPELKRAFSEALQEELAASAETEVPPAAPAAPVTPPAEPAPQRKTQRMPDDYGLPAPDENEPDMTKFDQLRMRRLESFPN